MNTSSSFFMPFSFRFEHAALILLLLFHLYMNLWWLRVDEHGIQSDEELHMLTARAYHEALFPVNEHASLGARLSKAWWLETPSQSPVHPPLLPLTGALAVALFGYSVDVLAFCNTFFFLLMLIAVFQIAKGFLSTREALYAVAVVSFAPMLYTASRYFMTDYLSMTLCVWAMLVLMRSRNFLSTRSALLFGILNGLALLARLTTPIYYFLPALFFFIQGIKENRNNKKALLRLFMNGCLAVVATLAIAAPWYVSHAHHFYHYWTDSDLIRQTGSPLAWQRDKESEVAEPVQTTPASDHATSTTTAVSSEQSQEKTASPSLSDKGTESSGAAAIEKRAQTESPWTFQRTIPWTRYPVMVINNGLFLPMFFLSVAGIVCLLFCSRYRRHAVPRALLLWILGSWFFLTLLFSFATPRYALQLLPALALFSTLPFFILRHRKVMVFLQCLYLGILLFQYGNLTVSAYEGLSSRAIAVQPDPPMMTLYNDEGLYWFKEELHGSYAYSGMGAPTAESYKDRIFLAMLKEEQQRPYSGIEANYVRVNMRGMGLEEAHYRPDPPGQVNPWRKKEVPEALQPWRSFRHFGWSHGAEEILPMLLFADYIVYTTELLPPGEEERWLDLFAQEGFELVERFYDKRHGMVREKYFGVLARKMEEPLPVVAEASDMEELEPMDLYRLRHSREWARLDEALKRGILERLERFFQTMGSPRLVNEKLAYVGCGVSQAEEELYQLHLIFKTRDLIKEDLRIIVQGQVDAHTMRTVFHNSSGKGGLFRWPVLPSPVSSLWPAQEHVIVRVPLRTKAATYAMEISFQGEDMETWGQRVPLGMITLAE